MKFAVKYLVKRALVRTITHSFLPAILTLTLSLTQQRQNCAAQRGCGASEQRHAWRIAVPKSLCVLREYIQPRPKSGKVRRSDTRPGDVCECAERSKDSDSAPTQNAPLFRRVCPCVRFFPESRVCTCFRERKRMWAICARS